MSRSRIFNRFSIIPRNLIRRQNQYRFYTANANVHSPELSEERKERKPTLPACLKTLGLTYLEPDELRQRFDEYDLDHTGAIDVEEARQILFRTGNKDATIEEAQAVVDSMDADYNGKIEWKEFKAAVDRAAEPVDKRVYPLGASLLINFIGQGAMAPILPLLARSYGLAEGQLGLVTGIAPFVRLLVNVPAATLADTVGRRPLTIYGPLITAGAFVLFGYSTTFTEMMIANGILGIGTALNAAAVGLYMADISTPRNRARTNSPVTLCALLGLTIGPAIGGFLADFIDLHSPFFVSAFACTLCSVICYFKIPETMRGGPKKEQPSTMSAWQHILQDSRLVGLYTAALSIQFAAGSNAVSGMLFCVDNLGMSPGEMGYLMTANVCAMGVMIPTVTKYSDKIKGERHKIMIPALVMQGGFLFCQPFCSSIPPFVALAVASSFCVGAIIPNINAFLLDFVIPSERAGALALRNSVQDLGLILGGAAMGFYAQAFGVPAAMMTTGTLVSSSGIFLWYCCRKFKTKSS